MSLQYIDNEKIYYAFLSGAKEVIKQKRELNKINVFPVPDGDTGTNLAFTMNAILEEAKVQESVKKTMESIAEAALTGARGNSGIIFAQFINGLYMGLEDKKNISIKGFSKSVKNAVKYAYKSITNPIEGTMITVMQDWSNSLEILKDQTTDFTEILSNSFEVALQSLKETPNKLKVLKNASVVDSGAKGFVHFLEGFGNFIKTKIVNQTVLDLEDVRLELNDVHIYDNPNLTYRFCTEALVKGENLNLDKIKLALNDLGDSLIVAGHSNKIRIHIHTNEPAALFHRLKHFGQIVQQKAEDMRRQYEATHTRKHQIALVTDSIADLPKDLMDLHQIHMIPLNLIIEDTSYLDKTTITPSYLYNLLDEAEYYPTSSQPTVKATEDFLNFIAINYDSIVVVTVSKQMSGTYETILKAANMVKEQGKKISIIDSKLNSGAQGLVVLKAAEEIAAGRSFEEVVHAVENTIKNTKIFVSVSTLKYMVRSGRVKKIQGFAAKLFNLKPVVSIDSQGRGIIIGKSLSVKANTKKMKKLVNKIAHTKKIVSYSIVHADALDRAYEYEQIFTQMIGKKPAYTTDISSVVALNAGVGCVAIALTTD